MEARRVCILVAVAAAMIYLYGGIDYTSQPYSGWDLASYRTMASASPGVSKDVGKPFVHRLLGPYVAGLLPLPDPAAFRALAVGASILLVLGLYGFLRREGLAPNLSLVTAALATFNKHWFGFTAWDFFQVNDVLALLFMLVMLWSMLEERWSVFAAALLLGALTKETSMLMVPVLFVHLLEKKAPARIWGAAVAAVVPGVTAFAAVRAFVTVEKGMEPLEALRAYGGKIRSPERVLRLLINSWLPYSLLPLVAPGATVRFLRERKCALALLALTFLGALFGANDERLMAPAMLVVYYLIGTIMRDIGLGKGATAVMVAAGFASSFHHIFARYPLPHRAFTEVLSLTAVLVVTCTAVYCRFARSRPEAGSGDDATV